VEFVAIREPKGFLFGNHTRVREIPASGAIGA
jgi:hypothetical protein